MSVDELIEAIGKHTGPLAAISLSASRMNYRTLAAHLQLFIDNQQNISGAWNGKDDAYSFRGQLYYEEDAHRADDLVKLAQPLLKELRELINDNA